MEKIIERTKQMLFAENNEVTLFIESIRTNSEIQNFFAEIKYKIKNL